jgi:hypothetical protein
MFSCLKIVHMILYGFLYKKKPVGPILELDSILTLNLSELEEIETKKKNQAVHM